MLDKQDYMRACVCTPPFARAPARKRTRARKRRQMCNTFPRQQWFANAPQYYVIRTLPALLLLLRITCTKCWRFIKHQCNRKICVSCFFQLCIRMWKNYSRYFCVRMEKHSYSTGTGFAMINMATKCTQMKCSKDTCDCRPIECSRAAGECRV